MQEAVSAIREAIKRYVQQTTRDNEELIKLVASIQATDQPEALKALYRILSKMADTESTDDNPKKVFLDTIKRILAEKIPVIYFKIMAYGMLEELKKKAEHDFCERRLREVSHTQDHLFTTPPEHLYEKLEQDLIGFGAGFIFQYQLETLATTLGIKKRNIWKLIDAYVDNNKIKNDALDRFTGALSGNNLYMQAFIFPDAVFFARVLQLCEDTIASGGPRKQIEALESMILNALVTYFVTPRALTLAVDFRDMLLQQKLGVTFDTKLNEIYNKLRFEQESPEYKEMTDHSDTESIVSASESNISDSESSELSEPVNKKNPFSFFHFKKGNKPSRRVVMIEPHLTTEQERQKIQQEHETREQALDAKLHTEFTFNTERTNNLIEKQRLEQERARVEKIKDITEVEISISVQEMLNAGRNISSLEENKKKYSHQLNTMNERIQKLEAILLKLAKNSNEIKLHVSMAHLNKDLYMKAYKNAFERAKKKASNVSTAEMEDVISRYIEASVEYHTLGAQLKEVVNHIEQDLAIQQDAVKKLEEHIQVLRNKKSSHNTTLTTIDSELENINKKLSQAPEITDISHAHLRRKNSKGR